MKRIILAALALASLANLARAADDLSAGDLPAGFARPPQSARPWVYWFPLSGNLSKEGITADLEALQRVGIGGVLYMEVDQGAPAGPANFAGPLWRELFQHACKEANRLGLQINMNNDAGWCGSGGPWITPELSMQKVTWSETRVKGGRRFEGLLPEPPTVKVHNTLNPITFQPEAVAASGAVKGYYADIAVLAVPEPMDEQKGVPAPAPAPKVKSGKRRAAAAMAPPKGYRIEAIQGKASFVPQHFPPQPATFATLPASAVIPRDRIIDLTAKMQKDGRIAWDAPPGKWLLLRFGHTTTGKDNHPAPASGRGLECDKLSKEAAEAHFKGLMGRLIAENRDLAGQGKVLVSTHIDSWEVGSQNWTPRMREEFRRRRGYDLLPLLPIFTGRVVDSLELSERFLWDLRQTVSDMLIENYAGHFRTLANRQGLRLSIEAYDGVPCDEMTYAGQADEPMSEFWSWAKFGAAYSCTEMSSAAHVYGKRILGAEAFTANAGEKWQGHPAFIKDLGDWAFCEGINRFVFHRYAMQPWVNPARAPGMAMGPWGLHYERTQTWWEQSNAWHEYLARCQYLLQQGMFVADICYLQPEGAPRRFTPPPSAMSGPNIRGGYNFDGCTPEVVLTRMSVKDGRIVLPDGMSYRLLVLPQVETMTPALLGKIKELVLAGATVMAPSRPQKAPGLSNYPACDEEVKALAADLWGGGAAPAVMTERRVGQGRIVWGGELSPHAAPAGKAPAGKAPGGKFQAAAATTGVFPPATAVGQWLAKEGLAPDFSADRPLRYIHRRIGEADVYFVANGAADDCGATCSFRVAGKQPELWHPETGSIAPLMQYEEQGGCTHVPLRLGPTESVFIVFRRPADAAGRLVSVTRDGQAALAVNPPSLDPVRNEITQRGSYVLKTADGRSREVDCSRLASPITVGGPWEVAFDPKWGGPAQVTFQKLEDWSKRPEKGIKYYSGAASYRTTFKVSPEAMTIPNARWYLDLNRVAVMAEVRVNGKEVGIAWKAPYRVDVTEALKPGENVLDAKVVNLWVNRQIGDEQLPDDCDRTDKGTLKSWPKWLQEGKPSPTGRYTFSSWKLWKKGDPLQESGLLGPVVLRQAVRFDVPSMGK